MKWTVRRLARCQSAMVAALAIAMGAIASGAIVPDRAGAQSVTPELVEAAKKEKQVNFYCSADLPVCEKVSRDFEAKYPGITVKVERSGSERLFQRIGQEVQTRINNCDVVNTSDGSHFLIWKREDMLAKWVPEDVEKFFPAEAKDQDGFYATWRASLATFAVNTSLVKPEEMPKSWADLLKPEWKNRIVKAHPGYSGHAVTTNLALVRMLGWEYLEKLAAQGVMHVQSAADPPRKVAVGERAVGIDGTELALAEVAKGAPIVIVYPEEGTPRVSSPAAVLARAPHPNAARLFASYMFSPEAQRTTVKLGWVRSFHPEAPSSAGVKPMSEIKIHPDDPADIDKSVEELKRRYTRIFGT